MENPLILTLDQVRSIQRSSKAIRFKHWIDEVRNLLDGKTPEDQKKALAANQGFIKGLANPRHSTGGSELERAVTPSAVHVDSLLSTFSVMYANEDYIGEQLMPVANVSKRSDKYAVYPKRERLAFPDDKIGYRASPNELDQTRTTDNYSVEDYGYKNFLDLETVQNQDAPLNEMLDVLEQVNEGIAFRREKRILTKAFDTANFGSNHGNAGTAWDNSTGGSIVADLLAGRAALRRGANPTRVVGFCPLAVWNTGIANNAAIRDLFKYTQTGLAVTTQVARYFRLDDILITEAWEDTANEGQAESDARIVTAKTFGLIRVAQRPTVRSLHWGTTFRMNGDPFSSQWPDPGIGKRGGIWNRTSVSEDHKVVAADAGFLVTSAIS